MITEAFADVCNSCAYEEIELGAIGRAERDRTGVCLVPVWREVERNTLIGLCDEIDVPTLCGDYSGLGRVVPALRLLAYRGCIAIGEHGPVVTAHGWRVVERLIAQPVAA